MESSTSKSHQHMNGHSNKNGHSDSIKNNGISVKNSNGIKREEEIMNPSPSLRVNGVTVFRPIIYGNVSYRLDRPPSKNQASSSRILQDDNQDWFRWTVYVRGIENEDLSYFIKKVVFYLHDSYTEPIRVIESAPFELTEEGWGQFEIKIEIFFHDIPGLENGKNGSLKRKLKMNGNNKMNGLNENGMDIDCYNNENDGDHKRNGDDHHIINEYGSLHRKRSYNDMMSMEKNGITTFELNNHKLQSMIKQKEAELLNIIPTIYNSSDENKISVIHPLRLFAKDGTEDSKKGIIEETFTEIEFIDPYYSLYQRLIIGPHKLVNNHPFQHHWKNKVIQLAENEQFLIDKISSTHRELLKKIESAKEEYQTLLKQQKEQQQSK